MKARKVWPLVVVVGMMLAGCNGLAASGDKPAPTAEQDAKGDVAAEEGSADKPLAPGTSVDLADWSLALAETDTDAWPEIQEHEQFNPEPASGHAFVMVPVTGTYNGDGAGNAWLDVSYGFSGADGKVYQETAEKSHCGILPAPLIDFTDTPAGEQITGNVCIAVPDDQIKGGSWVVTDLLTEEFVHYALK